MNTNIVISQDTRRAKNDGTFPIVLRLGHNERTTTIPTGISIPKKDWDVEKRIVKKTYRGASSVERLNNQLQKKKSQALDIINKLEEADQLNGLSIVELKGRLVHQNANNSFFTYAQELVDELIEANRIGTARSYAALIRVVKTFCKNKELLFPQLNYDFLRKFESYHYGKGNTTNGLAVYMRTIRAIYNKAIKSGIVEKDSYPFDGYTVKTAPTEKRALEVSALKKIIGLKLKPGHTYFNPRNYFVASYMMYGMNFTDMAFLQKTDIVNGRITYRRRKTSKLYDIKLTEGLKTILSHYMNQNPDSVYVFPIIKREQPFLIAKDIEWARKRYNMKLKQMARDCDIEQNLTSYVSRHSFATQAMLLEIPINAISTMLGHSSLKTTQVYLASLPNNILDDYNSKILSIKAAMKAKIKC